MLGHVANSVRSRSSKTMSSLISKRSQTRNKSFWAKVEMGPPDPILGVNVKFAADPAPLKLNLGVGAYRDDAGKPFILPCVREAEKRVYEAKGNHEYAGKSEILNFDYSNERLEMKADVSIITEGISGIPEFNTVAQNLVFGAGSSVIKSGQVVTAQSLSGTGALRIGTDFLRRFMPENKTVYLPNPTWGNHIPIAKDAGFEVASYRYYDASTIGLDEQGLLQDVDAAPAGSIFLFHVCAHNPTGVDPTQEQWKKISAVCKKKGHFVFFDMAYQGFASGDPERDVWPVRHFIEQGHRPLIAQSFAKNFGLYGERIGAVHIMTDSATESHCVDSQLKIIIRPHYSNPPIGGARLVSTILQDPELTSQWRTDVKVMADRIIKMRELLVQHLKQAGSKRDWSHVTKQIGMFCYSGLTPEQCDELASKYHIYMTRNGRISMAGVTSSTVEYLAKSIAEVTKFQ